MEQEQKNVGLEQVVEKAVLTALQSLGCVPSKEHDLDHEWVRMMRKKYEARARFWQMLAEKSVPGILWTLIVTAAAALWHLVQTHVRWSG